jgi:hypothetical protein
LIADDNGALPKLRNVACHLRMTIPEAEQIIHELVDAELLDVETIGANIRIFRLHDWSAHQFRSDMSAERTRNYRKRLKEKARDVTVTGGDGHRDVTVTAPESDTDSKIESLGPLSSAARARTRGRDDRRVLNGFEGKTTIPDERLVRRAEGLGLPVADLIEACNRHKARNRSAYFTALCVAKLQEQVPDVDENLMRAALWEPKQDAFNVLVQRIVCGAPR